MFSLQSLVRAHIAGLKPYSSARDEYSGSEGIFLDANENPLGSVAPGNFNRYPDPYQRALKQKLAPLKGVKPSQIFLGNGSDEAIDLLFRAFCEPHQDNIIIMPPTYGMYEVSANINGVEVRQVSLLPDFQMDVAAVLGAIDKHTKLIFVCSPNNPSGNSLSTADIVHLLEHFSGLVLVDEAYIDFAQGESFARKLASFPNLVVLQTFSKAWGLAALRLGMAFASEEIIAILNKIKPPYNINELSQQMALQALENTEGHKTMVSEILKERAELAKALNQIDWIEKVYPSDANFLLVKMARPRQVYQYLTERQIIVRDRSKVHLCDGCLRITVGTSAENKALIAQLHEWKESALASSR